MTIYTDLFWVLLPVICAAALKWGAGPERIVACLYLAAALATWLFRRGAAMRWHGLETSVLVVDVLLLVGLVSLMMRADRWWPISAALFQAISILAHVGAVLNPHVMRLGYAIMAEASSYPTLIVLAIGTVRHRRRLARNGADISWSR